MPTRFKYTKVESSTFGLNPAEILMATDAELNTYMGIKKYAPYRKEGKGRHWDAKRTERLQELKTKLQERGVVGASGSAGADKVKKRKGRKERMREKAAAVALGGNEDNGIGDDGGEEDKDVSQTASKEKKRKREDRVHTEKNGDAHEVDGETTKKKRRRHRKSTAVAASSS